MSIRCLQERSMICLLTEPIGFEMRFSRCKVAILSYSEESYVLLELISCLADPAYHAWYGVSAKP